MIVEAGRSRTRFFRPELERALAVIGLVALVGAIVLPVGWG